MRLGPERAADHAISFSSQIETTSGDQRGDRDRNPPPRLPR